MARTTLVIIGAIFMFVSIMFPTIFFANVHGSYFGKDVSGSVFYWMAGQVFAYVIEETSMGTKYHTMYSSFRLDAFGLICMTLILVGGVLAIVLGCATETKVAFIGGLLGLAGVIIFFLCVSMDIVSTRVHPLVADGYTPFPFVGFFVCILGSILALVGGTLDKY